MYVRATADLELPAGSRLRVGRPLYGLPEVGLQWYRPYHKYQVKQLFFKCATHDPCFMHTLGGMSQNSKTCANYGGLTCLQNFDTASAGYDCFITQEPMVAKQFDSKPIIDLKIKSAIKFNGANIELQKSTYILSQTEHIDRLEEIKDGKVDKPQFVPQRAKDAYIAAMRRQDLSFIISLASQVTDPKTADAKLLNKHIKRAKKVVEKLFVLYTLTQNLSDLLSIQIPVLCPTATTQCNLAMQLFLPTVMEPWKLCTKPLWSPYG